MAKKNPPDSTLRNVRAAKKRVLKATERIEQLETTVAALIKRVQKLESQPQNLP